MAPTVRGMRVAFSSGSSTTFRISSAKQTVLRRRCAPCRSVDANQTSTSATAVRSQADATGDEKAAPKPPKPATAEPIMQDSPTARVQAASSSKSPASAPGFEQVMGFDGMAPEVINGRAAMIGFLMAISSELVNGESVYAQLVSGGLSKALIVIAAVTIASFAPAIRQVPFDKMFGRDKQPASIGPFTPVAELINGRAAMLGLGVILFLEGANSAAFFLF